VRKSGQFHLSCFGEEKRIKNYSDIASHVARFEKNRQKHTSSA